jgi:2-methylaconitate cis-trans-isomerase PrpF
MIGHLAAAVGAPCPTLVLDRRSLPATESALLDSLHQCRRWLIANNRGEVLKIALIQPSLHPMFDLDYHFVQVLPDSETFDLRGSCGHSILAAVLAASQCGLLSPLSPGRRVRVNVVNNGDNVACQVDHLNSTEAVFTAHFLQNPPVDLTRLLLTQQPITSLPAAGGHYDVSLVSAGNPYIFVSAASLGVHQPTALHAENPEFFALLQSIRQSAARSLGWNPNGSFPKAAAVLPVTDGEVAIRAISVPGWHPTLALTGAVALAAACAITGTVAQQAAGQIPAGRLQILTPGGRQSVTATLDQSDGFDRLCWVSVGQKSATYFGSHVIAPLVYARSLEDARCPLPLSH